MKSGHDLLRYDVGMEFSPNLVRLARGVKENSFLENVEIKISLKK